MPDAPRSIFVPSANGTAPAPNANAPAFAVKFVTRVEEPNPSVPPSATAAPVK